MSLNTFLLDVNVIFQVVRKPNLEIRAQALATWLGSLKGEEVPDVIVLQEIFSLVAEDMMRRVCSESWTKNGGPVVECRAGSPFASATRVNNPPGGFSPRKGGGVVILAKRGHAIDSATDHIFEVPATDADILANKGFWVVRLMKGLQPYWVVGTHTQANLGQKQADIRSAQFRQMRAEVSKQVPQGETRVVFAGDMNVMKDEYQGMLEALGSPGSPAQAPPLEERGFWLDLDDEVTFSTDIDRNHYVYHLARSIGNQDYDWIATPGPQDRFEAPRRARQQVVPVQSDYCFPSDTRKGAYADDLSDHFGLLAELCYSADAAYCERARVRPVTKHRGAAGTPGGPDCPAPGGQRSCQEWCVQAGGLHGAVIGTAPACRGTCNDDCPNDLCRVLDARDEFTDYGKGCASGWKVCCCI